ncbi:MAG: hypothetical protein AAGH64_10090 [Planctomycetota bacterium]
MPAALVGVTDAGAPMAIDRPGAWCVGVLSNLHERGGGLIGYDHRSGVLLEMSADARVVHTVRAAGAIGHQRMRGMAVTEGGAVVLLDAPTDGLVVVTDGGERVPIATVDGARRMEAIATGDDGTLFGVGHASGGFSRTLYTIDLASGEATVVAALPVPDLDALTFASDGMLYATDADGSRPARLYRIDPETGACADLGAVSDGTITALSSRPVERGCWGGCG